MSEFMDQAKKLASEHSEQADQGLDKAAEMAGEKTGGKYDSQIQAGEQKVEIVNVCVSGFGMIERPSIPALELKAAAKPRTTRAVYFNQEFVETDIYDRAALGP